MILPPLDNDRNFDLPSTQVSLYLAEVICQRGGKGSHPGVIIFDELTWTRATVSATQGAMCLNVAQEIIVRQSPEAHAIIRGLLAEITELKTRIEELERRENGKTPQDASPLPSAERPHARP
jgi:hypothetical protein